MLDRRGSSQLSGLKTAVLHAVRAARWTENKRADVACGVQEAIVGDAHPGQGRGWALEYTGLTGGCGGPAA